jgi:hypothetical protein
VKRKVSMAVAVLLLCAGAAGGYWYGFLRRPAAERKVVSQILKAQKIGVLTFLQRGDLFDEDERPDHAALAKSFEIVPSEGPVYPPAKVSITVSDTGANGDNIVWLYPPDVAMVDSAYYRVRPEFFKELLRQSPKTLEFLKKKHPNLLTE